MEKLKALEKRYNKIKEFERCHLFIHNDTQRHQFNLDQQVTHERLRFQFLQTIVIPSFGENGDKFKTNEERENWMKETAVTVLEEKTVSDMIGVFNHITTLVMAKQELLKGEGRLEYARELQYSYLTRNKDTPELKKFQYSVELKENFPRYDGGAVIFQRDWFIKKTADLVLQKIDSKHQSHYWSAPKGSGKKVFLKLMGRELQERGCDVYYLYACDLSNYPRGYFTELAKEAGDKTVVLLIHDIYWYVTSFQWESLVEEKPANLLVIGVEHPAFITPQFENYYPQPNELFPMFLNENDLPEICSYFEKAHTNIPPLIIEKVCKTLLKFTLGHTYPFVKYAEHLLNEENKEKLNDIEHYLFTEEFRSSEVNEYVANGCFRVGNKKCIFDDFRWRNSLERKLFLEEYFGWCQDNYFSPFLTSQMFLAFQKPVFYHYREVKLYEEESKDVINLDDTQQLPYAQQIISAGFRDMTNGDFENIQENTDVVDSSMCHIWGLRIKSIIPNFWIIPQVRKINENKSDSKLFINFLFNEKYNLSVGVALNLQVDGIQQHLRRFEDPNERYHENGVILNVDTENKSLEIDMNKVCKTEKEKNRIYTFVKKENALYRGSKVVQFNVSRKLNDILCNSSTRSYSTFALNCLRRFVK